MIYREDLKNNLQSYFYIITLLQQQQISYYATVTELESDQL